jgi:predicted deacylase
LLAFSFGSQAADAPVLGLFGGVHGLERIGSQVVLALMKSFSEHLLWDETIQSALQKIRVVFFPLINPIGMLEKTRCNPQGVDLMRNAPVEAFEKPSFLIGGQHFSSKLPWYRGGPNLEPESAAVVQFCREQFFKSPAVITVDFHSGFGIQDQIWFPYAKTSKPFPHLAEMKALDENFERTHPHHFYKVEPQALNYTTHGDLWDYIYDLYRQENSRTYLPLALEMGSWLWVRKNPLQLFSSLGVFNPIKPHRQKRILRRHMTWFDFLIRATLSHRGWSSLNPEQKNKYQERALEKWYEAHP